MIRADGRIDRRRRRSEPVDRPATDRSSDGDGGRKL
jgi:hypothetical protein